MKIPNFATSGSVVQLDRMTDSGSVGWGFESPRSHEVKCKVQGVKCIIYTLHFSFYT